MPIRFKERLAMRPPGGWHFIEDKTTIRGETPEEVEGKLLDYRIRNGIPPGNPMQDLLNFTATRWPNLVENAEEPPAAPKDHPVYEKVWNWLVSISHLTNPGDVPYEQALEQTKICSQCPLNLPYPKSDDILKDEVERRSFLLRKGRPSNLGFCLHHQWDSRVAVYRNRNAINPRADSPTICWMNSNFEGVKLSVPELLIGKSLSEG